MLHTTMIRLCSASRGFRMFTLGAEGLVSNIYETEYHRGNARVVSNMGEPAWCFTGYTAYSTYIYDWGDRSGPPCGIVKFPETERYQLVKYAAIVSGTPLAFSDKNGCSNVLIASGCQMEIWTRNSKYNMEAVVDGTGQRLFVDESTANDSTVRPIGEHVPFGWWLPYRDGSLALSYAAFGDMIAYAELSIERCIPLWDVRTGVEVAKIHGARSGRYSRCAFTNEHLLTMCVDINLSMRIDRGTIATTVFDIRNMDRYECELMDGSLSLHDTRAFCMCSYSFRYTQQINFCYYAE